MKAPLISCIVPVFNGERYIRETLDSILAQTYRPLEIIVADDGSTDSTASIVASYGDQVRYQWQPNAGSPAARNLGLSMIHGEFVAFLDADDLWHMEKLARQIARFQTRPELDVCICHMQNFWSPELQEKVTHANDPSLSQPFPGHVFSQAVLARRALFDTVGQFNPELQHGDMKDWFLRITEHGAVMEVLTAILVYRRLHRTNKSHHKAVGNREDHLQLIKASLERRRHQSGTTSLSLHAAVSSKKRR